MYVRILIGAACGILAALAGTKLAALLLKRREKEFHSGKAEKWITLSISAAAGAAICAFITPLPMTIYAFLLLVLFEIISISDIHERIIPNSAVLAIIGLSAAFAVPGFFGAEGFPEFNLLRSGLGLAACFLIFMLPALFSKKIGAGDVKLAAAVGFAAGLWNSLICIVVMGVLVLVYMIARNKLSPRRMIKSMIPMGPFITISAMAVLIMTCLPAFEGLSGIWPF